MVLLADEVRYGIELREDNSIQNRKLKIASGLLMVSIDKNFDFSSAQFCHYYACVL